MSNFKCTFCPRTFAIRNGLSKHMSVCILSADDDDDHSTLNTLTYNRNNSKYIELY